MIREHPLFNGEENADGVKYSSLVDKAIAVRTWCELSMLGHSGDKMVEFTGEKCIAFFLIFVDMHSCRYLNMFTRPTYPSIPEASSFRSTLSKCGKDRLRQCEGRKVMCNTAVKLFCEAVEADRIHTGQV